MGVARCWRNIARDFKAYDWATYAYDCALQGYEEQYGICDVETRNLANEAMFFFRRVGDEKRVAELKQRFKDH